MKKTITLLSMLIFSVYSNNTNDLLNEYLNKNVFVTVNLYEYFSSQKNLKSGWESFESIEGRLVSVDNNMIKLTNCKTKSRKKSDMKSILISKKHIVYITEKEAN